MTRRRPNARSSRRVLGWAAGGFLAIQLAGGVILDYACPDVRFPLMRSMVEQSVAEPRPADVIILGSSRSDKSINATELTYAVRDATGDADFRAFNGTIGWSDALTMELALNRLLAAGAAPRVVIVEMTPVTVARNTQWYVTHTQRQLRWGDLPTHLGEIVGSHRVGGLVHDRVAPLYEHRYEIVKRLRVETGVFPPAPAPYTPPADRPRPEMSEEKWTELLESRAVVVEDSPVHVELLRDPKDAPILAAALASNADFLITGDRDLLDIRDRLPVRIVTVAEFAAEFQIV